MARAEMRILLIALFLIGSAFANLLVDGDMEAVGTGSWTSYHGTLTKDLVTPHGGLQDLMVAYLDSTQCYASQAVLTAGHRYHITGWAKSDGIVLPRVGMDSGYGCQDVVFIGEAREDEEGRPDK